MPGFAGKTSPISTVRVFHVVKLVATVRVRVEPDPEPTRQFGTVANTTDKRHHTTNIDLKIIYILIALGSIAVVGE